MTKKHAVVAGLVGAALTLGSSAVLAQDTGNSFYAGGSIGQSKAKDACEGVTISCDDKDTAWRIFGGYQVNRNFAVELGYADLGKATASGIVSGVNVNAKAEATAFDLVAVGILPVANQLS